MGIFWGCTYQCNVQGCQGCYGSYIADLRCTAFKLYGAGGHWALFILMRILRTLVVRRCTALQELPGRFVDLKVLRTLHMMDVLRCSDSPKIFTFVCYVLMHVVRSSTNATALNCSKVCIHLRLQDTTLTALSHSKGYPTVCCESQAQIEFLGSAICRY